MTSDTQTTEAPEFDTVRTGESFQDFAQRNGVASSRLIELNDRQLEEDARGRGFDHTFLRSVPDPEGGAQHRETGQSVRLVPDRHVFPGQRLRLRPADPE